MSLFSNTMFRDNAIAQAQAHTKYDHAVDALVYTLQNKQEVWSKMTQTADPFLREQQMKIRAVLRKNAARKLQGKKKRGIKWIKGKQAQCTLIGHVMIAKKCVYCGAEE